MHSVVSVSVANIVGMVDGSVAVVSFIGVTKIDVDNAIANAFIRSVIAVFPSVVTGTVPIENNRVHHILYFIKSF